MKIIATPVLSKELKPGDLFSTMSQIKWDIYANDKEVVGLKVYVRTDCSCPSDQEDVEVFKITMEGV